MKSTTMRYLTDEEKMYFGRETYTWRGDGFVKSDAGWYDNAGVLFILRWMSMNNEIMRPGAMRSIIIGKAVVWRCTIIFRF